MYIKHSKFKNTGILFEVMVKRITADTLSGKTSAAISILKEYFVNTELGKEYKLYEAVFKTKNISEGKANVVLTTVVEASKKLNRTRLRKEKYNLIKELKKHYNVEDLFRTKLYDYKAQASLFTLFEIYASEKSTDPNQIIDNKVTLLEHLTQSQVERGEVKDDVIEEFKSYDKDLRTLTYRVMLEKFNDKYSDLNSKQKHILKEFIESVDSTPQLKEFYNSEIRYIQEKLIVEIEKTPSLTIKIKLQEVSKLIQELDKRQGIKNNHLVDLLQYHSLLEELTSSNG
jgi:hypothetical protein|tara:strand:+ start:827 stop:1684 length:858 start_codon:yes stop_codon:yes gene_type:complete